MWRQVHSLEAELGVRLFERVGRRVRVTSAGEALLLRSRELLAGAEQLVEHAQAVRGGEVGSLSIAASPQEIFDSADMVIKVKEPQPQECRMLRRGQILFTYLHLAPDPQQAAALLESGAVCIAYETVTAEGGGLPLLTPMSEVAGRLAIEAAAIAILQKKLPDIRKSHDIAGDPGLVRAARDEMKPQGISAMAEFETIETYSGRIIWL